jgi:alanine racemase
VASLDVNLGAIAANYHLLKKRHVKQSLACVVKADAYGLGMTAVSKALWNEGCRDFFVATLDEGIALRAQLPGAAISVFSGLMAGEEKEYIHHQLMPVLNSLEHVKKMTGGEHHMAYIIHIDTGMTRLGLTQSDLENLRQPLSTNCHLIMSHLACAGDAEHAKNAEQLARFRQALTYFPGAKASLANSSGLFLSGDFHFDIARPGCALYGINPTSGKNPMQQVATLSAPILQIRTLDRDETVGYNATYAAKKGARIAIIGIGYADGWSRGLSNKGFAFVGGKKVPIAGIVSMDMIALDVSAVSEQRLASGYAELLNANQTVDDIATACDTIGYEIFTRLGNRIQRRYS